MYLKNVFIWLLQSSKDLFIESQRLIPPVYGKEYLCKIPHTVHFPCQVLREFYYGCDASEVTILTSCGSTSPSRSAGGW